MRSLKLAAVLVAAVAITAACGGDTTSTDEEGADSTDAGGSASTDDSSATAATSEEVQADSGAAGSDGARAVIVVGDRTYEMFPVEPSPMCFVDADGAMTVNGASADFDMSDMSAPTGATVYLLIQPNDWQPPAEGEVGFFLRPTITVSDLDTGENFKAERDFYLGFVESEDSAILESDLSDGHAEGTARFVEGAQATSQETPISYDGTFAVDCGS